MMLASLGAWIREESRTVGPVSIAVLDLAFMA